MPPLLTHYAERYGEIVKTGIGIAAAFSGESREQIMQRLQTGNFDGLRQEIINLLKAVLLDSFSAQTGKQVVNFSGNGIIVNTIALAAYIAYRSELRFKQSA